MALVLCIRTVPVAWSWAAVEGADGYVLQVGRSSGLSDVAVIDAGDYLTVTTYLRPGTYYGRVVPMVGGVAGTQGDEQVITV